MSEVTVHAHLVEASNAGTGKGGGVDAPGKQHPEKQHRHAQTQAATYEAGRDQIRARLPAGWIVASWRVE